MTDAQTTQIKDLVARLKEELGETKLPITAIGTFLEIESILQTTEAKGSAIRWYEEVYGHEEENTSDGIPQLWQVTICQDSITMKYAVKVPANRQHKQAAAESIAIKLANDDGYLRAYVTKSERMGV
jgi:hypothetical protein